MQLRAVGGSTAAGGTIQLSCPGLQHQGLHLGVTPHPEGNALSALEVVGQELGQLRVWMGQVGAELGHRPLTAPTETCPHLSTGLLGLHKQHKAFPLRPVGQEQGHGIGLIEAGEIPEITVLAKGPFAISVVGGQGRRRNHRRYAAKGLQEASTARGIDLGTDQHGFRRRG